MNSKKELNNSKYTYLKRMSYSTVNLYCANELFELDVRPRPIEPQISGSLNTEMPF